MTRPRPEAADAQPAANDGLAREAFARAMLAGLARRPKQTSPKWFYDDRGSQLFEAITELPEYALTRTEIALMREHIVEMVDGLGGGRVVLEFGAGSARKTPLLLAALDDPAAYVPIDVSAAALDEACLTLGRRFPGLPLHPLRADFNRSLSLDERLPAGPRLGFFPGSTLGNLAPGRAAVLLRRFAAWLAGGPLLLGLDTVKDEAMLRRAYDDAAGVTAAFNLNLLERMNRELGADFDPEAFEHRADWNPQRSRIEMHLVSRRAQRVRVAGVGVEFAAGESLHTENSYKYRPHDARQLFERAGWRLAGNWLAPGEAFAIYRLERPAR